LSKTMDSTVLDHEKLEFGTLTRNASTGKVDFTLIEGAELDTLIKEADLKAVVEKEIKDKK